MYIPLEINVKESSKTSPFAFFIDFFDKNLIVKARKTFLANLPNLEDENDYWISKCSAVDKQKEMFILEFSEENFDKENNIFKNDQVTVIVSFKSEIEDLFKKEYYISKRLIQEKFPQTGDNKINTKNSKEYVHDFFMKAILIINLIETNPIYVNYTSECLRPFYAIIRFIYTKFPDLAPDRKIDPCINEILKSSVTTENLYSPINLNREILEKILTLTDLKGKLIFEVKDIKETRIKLNNFFDHNFDKIASPIEITSKPGPANYIIAILSKYLGYTRPEIEKKKIFKIGKFLFLANPCNLEFSRLNKRKPDLALKINLVFSKSLIS